MRRDKGCYLCEGKRENNEYGVSGIGKYENTTKKTASRDLKYLTEHGILKHIVNTWKGTYYIIRLHTGYKRDKEAKPGGEGD